jgi:putative transcriptional regulator
MNTLEGHFLIAMPGMGDPNFSETVAFLCKHSDEGALGIIVNRESDMKLSEVFGQMGLEVGQSDVASQHVMQGGPVQQDRGFVVHLSIDEFESTVDPAAKIKVTVSQDIMKNLALGTGPSPALVALGYAGWDPGQLESELAGNAWLSAPADPDVIFSTPVADRWRAAAALLGIDIRNVASYSGHA